MSAICADKFGRSPELAPSNTALLAIDVQSAPGYPRIGPGTLFASRNRLDSTRYRLDQIRVTIVLKIQRLLSFFRRAGVPLIDVTRGAELADSSDPCDPLHGIVLATRSHAARPERKIDSALSPARRCVQTFGKFDAMQTDPAATTPFPRYREDVATGHSVFQEF